MASHPSGIVKPFLDSASGETAEQLASRLHGHVVPHVTDALIKQIQRAIDLARVSTPEHPVEFVATLNDILDVCNLRLTVDGHHTGRLYCRRLPSGGHSIRITGQDGITGGFRHSPVLVVRDPKGVGPATLGTELSGSLAGPPTSPRPSG